MKKRDVLCLQALLSLFFICGALAAAADETGSLSAPTSKIGEGQNPQSISKEAYLEKRKVLIFEDQEVNFSHALKLTEDEKKLNAFIGGIIDDLQKQFIDSSLFCPARNFFLAKGCIEESSLFSILQRMPKGGVMHIHTSSSGDANWLVKRAVADENCYIYMLDDGATLKWKMGVFQKGKVPKGYQLMGDLAAKDPSFIPTVVEMITLSSEDSASPNPWVKFNACFERVGSVLYYAPIYKDYYMQSFEKIVDDNIQIVELRAGSGAFNGLFDIDGRVYSSSEVIALYRSIIEKIREKSPGFVLKLIISDVRVIDLPNQRKSLEAAFKLRSEYPDLVVGYDLVGFETTGHKTFYYLDNLLDGAHEFSAKYHTTLPYYFHDGESDWSNDENLYDAVLLKSKRIGHAFNLFHFPELSKKVKQNSICLEICPISNQVLGYVSDLRLHPAAGYLKAGLPCVLSSDDPMLFKTTGLSYDFWEAIMAWNLDLADIKQLCMNSILYSSLEDREKTRALASWQKNGMFLCRRL